MASVGIIMGCFAGAVIGSVLALLGSGWVVALIAYFGSAVAFSVICILADLLSYRRTLVMPDQAAV